MNNYGLETDMLDNEIADLRERGRSRIYNGNLTAFYGSSSIRLWKNIQKDLSPHKVINLGFGGSTYGWCNHYFDQAFEFIQPSQIILYAGDNDLGNGSEEIKIIENALTLLAKIDQRYGKIKTAIISVKPSPQRHYLQSKMESLNEEFESIITKRTNGFFIDVHSSMMTDGIVDASLFIEDGLHMNEKGYNIWKRELLNYLDR